MVSLHESIKKKDLHLYAFLSYWMKIQEYYARLLLFIFKQNFTQQQSIEYEEKDGAKVPGVVLPLMNKA